MSNGQYSSLAATTRLPGRRVGIGEFKVLAFPELGMEAIYEFEVKDMPVTVAVDTEGNSIHTTGPAKWRTINK